VAEALLRRGRTADALDGTEGRAATGVDHDGHVKPRFLEQFEARDCLPRECYHPHDDPAITEINDEGGVVRGLGGGWSRNRHEAQDEQNEEQPLSTA
jgi:hypothetical protein